MQKKLKEQVDAFVAFVKFCKDNNIVWQNVEAFVTMLAGLELKIESIDSTEEAQEANKKGVTLTKRQKKTAMASQADAVALTAQSYARSKNDNELYSELAVNYSGILGAKDQEALVTSQRVYNIVNALPKEDLEKFGITEAVLDTLSDAIDVFAAVRPTTRNVKTRKEALTKNCKQLVSEGNDIMRKDLLKIGRQFKASHPDFYFGLVANAKVISSNIHCKLRITAKDSRTELPLTGAIVDIEGTGLQGVTDMKGKCTVTMVPAGKHAIALMKTGYERTVIEDVDFRKGKSTTLTANMDEVPVGSRSSKEVKEKLAVK
ncbi:MAG: hypothetical protein IPJ79_00315 [Bacteroidetes bacterium]|nr:hypothetical protein [Bacteroidota bacterium]